MKTLANEVKCPWCGADEGKPCVTTTSGREVRNSHRDRWDARRSVYRRPRRFVLKDDDPTFGLAAGDVLVCIPYWLDPEKVTVIYRERDGFDPQCNQYRRQVTAVFGSEGRVESFRAFPGADHLWLRNLAREYGLPVIGGGSDAP